MNETALYVIGTVVIVSVAVLFSFFGPYYETGIASWYGPGFHGNLTLPFGTIVRVIDLETGHSIVVRINDRGPFIEGRIIDLSKGAAEKLGMVERGIIQVGLRIVRWP